MADPNHVAIGDHRLVFMLPCKVGNTSIKAALADTLGRDRRRLHSEGGWDYRGNAEIARLPSDWLVVGFVRHPFARFLSAYRQKIRDERRFGLVGLTWFPDVEDVAYRLAQISDQHWRSLTDELTHEGQLLPSLVVRTDDMRAAWASVREAVRRHCGLGLADVPHLNRTMPGGALTAKAKVLIRAHYAEDFERFGYEP